MDLRAENDALWRELESANHVIKMLRERLAMSTDRAVEQERYLHDRTLAKVDAAYVMAHKIGAPTNLLRALSAARKRPERIEA